MMRHSWAVAAVCCVGLALSVVGKPRMAKVIPFTDGLESFDNPGCGVAEGGWVTFRPEGLPEWRGKGGFRSSLWELSRFSGGREQKGRRPPAERVGGADIPITAAMAGDVRRFLSETRQGGGTLIVRLGYTWSEHPGCEPADFGVLLGHIETLSRIIADFDDVVVAVEAGVAGPWGEMHSSDYCGAEYMNRILKAYLDNLGPRIPVLVRSPHYLNKFAGTKTHELLEMTPFTNPCLKRLGMYNDGYLGTWQDYGTWAGDFTRELGCRLLAANPDVPYGGEMAYVGKEWLARNMKVLDAAQWNVVKEWYETHLTYLRNLKERGHTLASFLSESLRFSTNAYAFAGMPGLCEYEGVDMNRFVRDHMGYRFVVRGVKGPRSLNRMRSRSANDVTVDLENTGFGKPLLPLKVEALLVRDGKVAASQEMNGLDMALRGGERRKVVMPLAGLVRKVRSGEHDLHVRVSMPCKDETPESGGRPRRPIRFANAGTWNESLGSVRLGAVSVR